MVTGDPGELVEGGPSGTFTFTLAEPAAAETEISYALSGDAVSGDDFTPLVPAIIAAGETEVSILVTPLDDGISEGSRDVTLTVTAGETYRPGDPDSATIAIIDVPQTTTTTAAPTTSTTAAAAAAVTTPRFAG